MLVQFSRLVVDVNGIKEIDLNPVIASSTEVLAVDARVVLHEKGAQIPLPAIRPYPYHYERVMKSKDGEILIRPVRADDQQIALDFMDRIASESNVQLEKVRSEEALKYLRAHLDRKSQIREQSLYNSLVTLCFGDFDREIVLLAFQNEEIIGIARVSRIPTDPDSAEMAIVVENSHQGKGIGGNLVQTLIEITKNEKSSGVGPWSGIKSVFAQFNEGNVSMMHVAQRFNMTISKRNDGRMIATAKL